ncbi:glycosyltransferase [Prescottella equi]|uniref:glycosyltransferase n=1 Tax=Rhodococcus hoagii TaxID=43767 RepID=UPI001F5B5C5C|nr:glycosyltransferase [Prescottella equi]UNQ39113.1 glycosyltransferase [Prescottella equi]
MSQTAAFISWIKFHGRSAELALRLGANALFIETRYPKAPAILRYVELSIRTVAILRRTPWSTIIIMLPPFPLLVVAKIFRKKETLLVADLHTGVFLDPKWAWARGLTMRMLRGHIAVVTNSKLAQECESQGVRAVALHDVVTRKISFGSRSPAQLTVLCPLAYASDEPIHEIFDAARSLPNFKFIMTGRAPDHVREAAPDNVQFSGYLSNADYDATMANSSVVLAMTTRDHTMQRAAYEALMSGVPIVTSDFRLLRDFFEHAAVYADCTASSIASALQWAIQNSKEIQEQSASVLEQRIADQEVQIAHLRKIVKI